MRLSAKAPIVIRGEEITHLDADGYKHLPRATALPDGKVLATSGGKWAPSDLSGVSVASVFGRTGAVAAQTGDYTAAQVGAEPYAGVPATTSLWRSTAAGVRAWVQLVAADITDLATTLAAYLTKANPTFTGTLTGPTAAFAGLTGTGNRPLVAGADGTIDDQDATAFRDTISVPPVLSFTGSVDAKALNGGKTGLYRLAASTYANFWTGITAGQQASVLQLESPTGLGTLIASDNKAGRLLVRFRSYDFPGDGWSDWYTLWDSGNLPVGTTGRAVLATTTQAAARGVIGAAPLAGAELLIHSDFGRVISTTGWQSTFTSNAASGLKLAANTVTNGTQIRFEQLFQGAGSASGAWQLALGPLLPAGTAPTYPAYLDVINTDVINPYLGRLIIEIEFLGSGSSMVAHVISRVDCDAFGGSYDQVSNGTIPFDATVDRYLDIQVQPAGMTSPVIRRNRVFRRNP